MNVNAFGNINWASESISNNGTIIDAVTGSEIKKEDLAAQKVGSLIYAFKKDTLPSLIKKYPNETPRGTFNEDITEIIDAIRPSLRIRPAIEEGDIQYLKSLQDYQLKPLMNMRSDGRTMFHYAISKRQLPVIQYLIIERGIRPYIKDEDGKTALMWAAIVGDKDILEFLSGYNANINDKDHSGRTALSWSITSNPDNRELLRILISAGATVSSDDDKSTDNPETGKYLLQQYFRQQATKELFKGIKEDSLTQVHRALLAEADPNAVFNYYEPHEYETPLAMAIQRKNIKMMQMLLEAGANPNNSGYVKAFDGTMKPKLSLLDKAILQSNAEAVQMLLRSNAKLILDLDKRGNGYYFLEKWEEDIKYPKRMSDEDTIKLNKNRGIIILMLYDKGVQFSERYRDTIDYYIAATK